MKKFVICKEAIIQHKIESGGGICLCPNLKDWGKNKKYSKVIDQIENCVKWTCANFCMKAKAKVTNLYLQRKHYLRILTCFENYFSAKFDVRKPSVLIKDRYVSSSGYLKSSFLKVKYFWKSVFWMWSFLKFRILKVKIFENPVYEVCESLFTILTKFAKFSKYVKLSRKL